ncbi:hypothetical protein ACFFMN_07935 [Planobispora siamensis]|uniref:Uncharacterized protein n=1 Tax=Planobispora siamensis TaxID=936338 RepID=A0A8J3SBS8_9ACTN|nr:hypothetical protein [Planobispora siamensis]GIH90419.1 hypothetical protein Psi01_10490 [Planobispora siamensis]
MHASGIEFSPSVANDVSHASDLRAAARWLVGASATVVAALVAGLQLRDLDGLDDVGPWAVALALTAVLGTLASVVWTLYRAAEVLSVPQRSIDELSELDREDQGDYPNPRLVAPATGLVRYLVVERRADLLGASRDAIWQLTQDHNKAQRALLASHPVEAVEIGGRVYDLRSAADSAALSSLAADLERRVQRVVDAASAYETQRRYERLARGLRWAGVPFVASLLVLTWLTTLPPRLTQVTTPTPIEVLIPAGMPCGGRTLQGMAVGGTMDAPIVVLPAQQGCSPRKLSDTRDLVVVPRPVDVVPQPTG